MAGEQVTAPVRYTDDLYYIGTRKSPCWLLKGTDGLILIDTAMPEDAPLLAERIESLGHRVEEVRHIVHSHGHIDHIGCTAALVARSGARTYISAADADIARGNNQLQWTNEYQMPFTVAFEPDVLLSDGDELDIGGHHFRFVSCPGHTAGTLSIFFDVTDGGQRYRAGMFGGGGLASMARVYLDRYGLPHTLREAFLHSIDRVRDEAVTVHVGNHLGDNGHFDKLARVAEGVNPFLDGSTWTEFLDRRRREAVEYFKTN
ncbi:MAG: MBL fold metallo-hydrolase [Clostridia bacterium]|nr:MBL fold metallo-hydrolase [Clostridia bacterium]